MLASVRPIAVMLCVFIYFIIFTMVALAPFLVLNVPIMFVVLVGNFIVTGLSWCWN